ncbi:MAG TPA: shikimate kinase [Burkholderiales bacterium]|nr:shikimate kinase [Burkholderiales bacterium]
MGDSRNIYLVGLMGAGKTTVGKQLAHRLGKSFHDADHDIEKRTGVRVATIFEIEGEAGFRAREVEAIERLTEMENIVLATGGGAVLDARNRERLAAHGYVIYLHGLPRDLWQRTRHDKSRPLLSGEDPLAKLKELYGVRDPLYREIADLVLDTGKQSVSSLMRQLLNQLPEACKLSA